MPPALIAAVRAIQDGSHPRPWINSQLSCWLLLGGGTDDPFVLADANALLPHHHQDNKKPLIKSQLLFRLLTGGGPVLFQPWLMPTTAARTMMMTQMLPMLNAAVGATHDGYHLIFSRLHNYHFGCCWGDELILFQPRQP